MKDERREQRRTRCVNFGAFSRSLTLPFAVDAEKVDARFENGVLTVKLTKHESAKPRNIAVERVRGR